MKTRAIFITGANGGLGQAIARAFLDESPHNRIYLGVHRRRNHADAIAAEHPERCQIIELDVTQRPAWDAAVARILTAEGGIAVLVNNAGAHTDMLLAQMSEAAWRQVLAINLDSVFHGCQAVLPSMISQRQGRIINVASLSALSPPPGQANYAAAKAGVIALSQALAKEVARIGITVNCVSPGYVETESLLSLDPDSRQTAAGRIPMRRFGTPAEIASAIRFLACPTASYITGSNLKIDGGLL